MTPGSPEGSGVRRVVLTPELLGRSFSDPASFQVLELWRDGRVQPVVNRQLLVRYLRLLTRLGVSPLSISRWIWWLTTPPKTIYVKDLVLSEEKGWDLCAALAKTAATPLVVFTERSEGTTISVSEPANAVRYIKAAELVKLCERA